MIAENAPDAIKTGDIKAHFGRKVAIVRPCPLGLPLVENRHDENSRKANSCPSAHRMRTSMLEPLSVRAT